MKVSLIVLAFAAMIGAMAMARSSRADRGAWMGVVTQSVDYDLAEAFDLDVKYGVIVNELVDDSPAQEVGIKIDDIIIAINSEEITDYDDLVEQLEEHKPGDKVSISLIRDGEKLSYTIELAKRPRGRSTWNYGSNQSYDFGYSSQSRPSTHAYIGVHLSELSRQLGEFFGVDKARGALIREIEEDSPAEEAGLKAGDVIIAIDSDKIRDVGDVSDYISDMEPGDKVKVTVMRDKAEVTLEVEVDESRGSPRFGGLGHNFYMPDIPSMPQVDINLDDLDALSDLDIRIPNLSSNYSVGRTGRGIMSDRERDRFDRDMEEFRKDMQEMLKDLRKELKLELDELRELIDN